MHKILTLFSLKDMMYLSHWYLQANSIVELYIYSYGCVFHVLLWNDSTSFKIYLKYFLPPPNSGTDWLLRCLKTFKARFAEWLQINSSKNEIGQKQWNSLLEGIFFILILKVLIQHFQLKTWFWEINMMTLDLDTLYINFDWLKINFEIKKTINFMQINSK